jgi:uncharacterized membrane protein
MQFRKILRMVLGLVVLLLLWRRAAFLSGPWLKATIVLSVLLVLALIVQVVGMLRKPRNLRDEVPKHPLGLE